jgi:imidazolonepropionase-like amidohydrolase
MQQGATLDRVSVTDDWRRGYVPRSLRADWVTYAHVRTKGGRSRQLQKEREEFAEEVTLAGTIARAGVPVLAGSDAGALYTYPGFSLHDELALLVRAGLKPVQAIHASSGAVTEFLGLSDSLGTVRPGRAADLLILEGDPIRDIRNTRRIQTLIYRGREYDRAGLDSLLARARDLAGR